MQLIFLVFFLHLSNSSRLSFEPLKYILTLLFTTTWPSWQWIGHISTMHWTSRIWFGLHPWDLEILQIWSHKLVSPIDCIVIRSPKSQEDGLMGPCSLHSLWCMSMPPEAPQLVWPDVLLTILWRIWDARNVFTFRDEVFNRRRIISTVCYVFVTLPKPFLGHLSCLFWMKFPGGDFSPM